MPLPPSVLTHNQKKKRRVDYFDEHGDPCVLIAEIRHDDECRNGHNTFSITGEIYEKHAQRGEPTVTHKDGRTLWLNCGGCIHEEIAKRIPDLAPYIKWHLCSTDGPMHYIANTLYSAGNRDCNGRTKGERYHVLGHEEKRIVFGEFPISFEFKHGFSEFIEKSTNANTEWDQVKPVPVGHPPQEKGDYQFAPKWTISGHGCEWYQCPFDREEEAQDFIKACQQFRPRVVVFQDKYTRIGEGKARELDSARNMAIWPDATDEQLTQHPVALKADLMARLPALMLEFKAAVESLGFTY